jgi:hypothetical protein
MFFESQRILTDSGSLTLNFIEDTSFALMATYPPIPILGKVNGLIAEGDTVFAFGGLKANISYTLNKGANWLSYDTLPMNQSTCEVLDAEYIDGVMYAGGYFGGLAMGFIYKSSDNLTWNTTLEQPVGVSKVFDILHVGGDTFLMATGDDDVSSCNMDGVIYKSYDNCSTWTELDTVGLIVTKLVRVSNDTIFACGDNADTMNYYYLQPVKISVDGGSTWEPVAQIDPIIDSLLLNEGSPTVMMSMNYIANYLYAGSWTGDVYRSGDFGNTWEKLDTLNTIPDTSEITGFYSFDEPGVIYLTSSYPGRLYKSYDGGYTVEISDEICDTKTAGMVKLAAHTYIVGATTSDDGGKIYYDSYYKSGYLVSSAFDLDRYDSVKVSDYLNLYEIRTFRTVPNRTTFIVKIRTGSDSLMSDAMDWTACPIYTMTLLGDYYQGKPLDSIASVVPGQSYFQYRFDFTRTAIAEATPILDSIWMQKFTGVEVLRNESASSAFEIKKVSQFKYLVTTEAKTGSVKLFDLAGRVVSSTPITNGKTTLILNVPAGRYSIRVYDEKGFIGKEQITVIK